jgi:hypothetical protein
MVKLIVKTELQKQLFLLLENQLSDGWWENSTPNEHYKPWQLVEDEIGIDGTGETIGTYSIPSNAKRNYNFTNRQFIEVVGAEFLIKTSCPSISELRKNLKDIKLAMKTRRA